MLFRIDITWAVFELTTFVAIIKHIIHFHRYIETDIIAIGYLILNKFIKFVM